MPVLYILEIALLLFVCLLDVIYPTLQHGILRLRTLVKLNAADIYTNLTRCCAYGTS